MQYAELQIRGGSTAVSGWRMCSQVEVARVYVGTFMTSLDMAGFSLSVCVLDDQRIAALDAETQVCLPRI